MAKSRQEKRRRQNSTEPVSVTIETRIDPPHVAARPDSPEPLPPMEGFPAALPPEPSLDAQHPLDVEHPPEVEPALVHQAVPAEYAGQRLRKQADQLATHLRTRQKEIDYREAQINAQMAQIDRDARTARMWLCEKEAGLEQRATELDQREQEIKVRLGRVAAEAAQQNASDAPAKFAALEAALATREDELNRKAAELAAREAALAEQPKPAETAPAQPTADDAQRVLFLRVAEELEAKQQDIHRAEAQLAHAYAETEKLRQMLVTDRTRIAHENEALREQLQLEHRREAAELEKQKKVIERRSEHVDRTKAALRQLRVELGKIHRETLEAQLATEELWIQLSESTPSATLTRSLGRIRARLAEQYRLINADTQAERDELEKVREQLTEQYEKLVEKKREVERWAVAQHEEAEQHAARLIARERELEDQHYDLQEQAQRLQAERLSYHRAVRRIEVEQPEHQNPSNAG